MWVVELNYNYLQSEIVLLKITEQEQKAWLLSCLHHCFVPAPLSVTRASLLSTEVLLHWGVGAGPAFPWTPEQRHILL